MRQALALTVLLTPLLITRFTFEVFEFPKMIVLYVVTILFLGVWILNGTHKKKWRIPKTPYDGPICALVLATFLSTLFALHPYTAWVGYYTRFTGGFLSLLVFLILFYAILNLVKNRSEYESTLVWPLVVGVGLISWYAIMQRFGLDTQYWVQRSQDRVFSTLGQPNWLAAYLAALIPMMIGFASFQKRIIQVIVFSIIFAASLALLFTFSVTGIIGLVVGLLIMATFIVKKNLVTVLFVTALTLLLLGIGIRQGVGKTTLTRISETGTIRTIVWSGSIETIKKAPLHRKVLGYGPGNFAYAFLTHRPIDLNHTSEWDFLFNKPHNEALDIAVNQGLLGLLVSVAFAITIIHWHIRTIKETEGNKKKFLAGIFGGWCSLLITSFFGFLVVPTTLLFWALPALSLLVAGQTDTYRKSLSKPTTLGLKLATPLIGFILIYGAASFFITDVTYTKGRRAAMRGDLLTAEQYLTSATKKNTHEARYTRDLAEIESLLAYRSQGDERKRYIERSASHAVHAYGINPKNSLTIRSVLSTFIGLGILEPHYLEIAEGIALESVTAIPTDPTLRYLEATVYYHKGEYEKAGEAIEKALELKKDHPQALTLEREVNKTKDR